ncbi:MAG TPA: tRNA lysidine(34) synthetase TilS [Geomonas sp.]|nr:tRNA lysidine(34) synthetase TilS [Geomonas sp.]HJV34019.1 tRNA lysidine(34) synthetase TilS [Geomonas sp.]
MVVAVSGGADSVALLDILVQLKDREGLNLVVAHLNHGLRATDSDGDQEFVARLAAGYGLPCLTKREDVARLARDSRLSLEDAGRRARYAFFAEVARAQGATSIALAHHLDDQAETVLIRLLRGAGTDGLSAMTASSGGILKRPLLQVSRAELEQYLKLRGLGWRTDSTNDDTSILRNSIRHELIPQLRRYNPRISERLAATAGMLGADQQLLDGLTEAAYLRLARADQEGIVLEVEPLASEPRGLRLRLYRRALQQLRGDLQRITLRHLEAIDLLISSDRPNARLKLPGACFISRHYHTLRFSSAEEPQPLPWELVVAGEGSYPLPTGGQLLVKRLPRPADIAVQSRRSAFLDPAGAPFPWLVRTFRPGDRFRPLGMNGLMKVKELFINEKVPPAERRRIPLLESGGRIVWVAGLRVAEEARVTDTANEVLWAEILDP